MPTPLPPPVTPPTLKAPAVLGVVMHCQNETCRRRGWVEPQAVEGQTVPALERKAKCQACGTKGARAEVFWAQSRHAAFRTASDAEFADKWRSWIRAHPYP